MGLFKFKSTFLGLLLMAVGSWSIAAEVSFDFPADENSCPSIDLRSEFDFGPVRNQKNLGWCYAYATADVVSFRLRKQVSPFDIALSTIQTYIRDENIKPVTLTSVEGGSVPVIARSIAERGVCDAVKFSASSNLAAPALEQVELTVIDLVRKLRSGSINEFQVRKSVTANTSTFHTIFPTSSLEDLVQAVLQNQNINYPLQGFVDQICSKRNSAVLGWGSEIRGEYSSDIKFRSIRGVVASHMPVLINYSSEVLKDVNATSVGGHASTIVGMKYNSQRNRCEFLLRNSWGVADPYRVYDPELRPMISNGYVWIPEETLRKNIQSAWWIY